VEDLADVAMTESAANPKSKIQNLTSFIAPALIVLLSAIYKLVLLVFSAVPFNGDEAIVALMARHILRGERPVFFYGQAYLGATDAWLIAASFSIFGETVCAIRVVHIALYAGVVFTTYLLARRYLHSEWGARAAMLWLALPPTLVTLYTTATLGGYTETLLLGNILLLMADGRWLLSGRWRAGRWLLFGFIAGFAFYTFPLILIYLVPIGLLLLYRMRVKAWRGFVMALVGFGLGSLPWWWALIQSGGVLIAELTGSAVAGSVQASGALSGPLIKVLNFFVFGTSAWWGLRYPWAAEMVLPLLGVAAFVFYLGALGYAVKRGPRVLWGMILTLLATFLLTPFGGDPSGRYFLPLAVPLAIFAAMLLQRFRKQNVIIASLLLALLVGYNVAGTLAAAAKNPPGITTQFDPVTWLDHGRDQELIDFLLAHGETRGYSTYWVQTPIAFLSGERIISAARLPYHAALDYTPRDDRYPPYTQAVREAPRAFYITHNHPALAERIRSRLTQLTVTFQEHDIGNYHIFYALSRKVEPAELGIYDPVTP
jgi:hypothetical protein